MRFTSIMERVGFLREGPGWVRMLRGVCWGWDTEWLTIECEYIVGVDDASIGDDVVNFS